MQMISLWCIKAEWESSCFLEKGLRVLVLRVLNWNRFDLRMKGGFVPGSLLLSGPILPRGFDIWDRTVIHRANWYSNLRVFNPSAIFLSHHKWKGDFVWWLETSKTLRQSRLGVTLCTLLSFISRSGVTLVDRKTLTVNLYHLTWMFSNISRWHDTIQNEMSSITSTGLHVPGLFFEVYAPLDPPCSVILGSRVFIDLPV